MALMAEPFVVARTQAGEDVLFLPALANRHGLVTGATGTGKTVTLQVLADHFSQIGVPVFVADVKGDLSGVAEPGAMSPKLAERLKSIGATPPAFAANPVAFWDVFGKQGTPIRATISDLGPLLLGRLFGLNATQQGVLALIFKVADDNGLLLLDIKDLRAMLQFAGDNASQFTTEYGNISTASIGAIQRSLLEIEQQGGASFFGEPMLDVDDLLQTDSHGRGVVNVLAADELIRSPKLYAMFLLWMLSGAVRTASGNRRSGQAGAGVLLRRGAPAVQRRAGAAARKNRAGRALDQIEGGRGVLRHAEPCRRAGHRTRSARQPGAARVAGVHAARSESRQDRCGYAAPEPVARSSGA